MKTKYLTLALLLISHGALAQTPTDSDLYVGETVTIKAPHFIDDGRIGKIISYNGVMANVEYSIISKNDKNLPMSQTTTKLWKREMLSPTRAVDLPYHNGQMVRIMSQGFVENRIIGNVKASDGKLVVVEYNSDPTTKVQGIWSKEQVQPSSHAEFGVLPGDIIRVNSKGYLYSSVNSKVLFNNGARIWIGFTDNSGKDLVDVIPASNYTVIEQAFRVDFDTDGLPDSLKALAGVIYGSRQTFFSVIGEHLNSEIPLDGNFLTASSAVSARVFTALALAPVIEDSDSEIFEKRVIPAYREMKASLPVHSLSEIDQSFQVSKAACLILRASLEGILQSVGNPDDKLALTNLHTKVGILAASQLHQSEINAFLTSVQSNEALFTRLIGDYQTKSLATTFAAVIEYLKAKN